MEDYFSCKKISELTGISTHALRYYDQIGLLNPTRKTYTNHRRYSEADLERLQQITILRYLDFSIEQIKNILSDECINIRTSLCVQEMIMIEKSKRLTEASRFVSSLILSLDQNKSINWQLQSKIIDTLKLQDSSENDWYKIFLTQDEAKELHKLSTKRTPEFWENYKARWAVLFKDIEAKLYTDPESKIGMQFAKRWFDLVNEVYKNNRALGDKVWEGYKSGVITDSTLDYNPRVLEYMAKAKKKYLEKFNESI